MRASSNFGTRKEPGKKAQTCVLSNEMVYLHHSQFLNKSKK